MAILQAIERARPVSAVRPWLVVLGSALALMVGNGPIIQFTFGTLVVPITVEFGWPRATLAAGVAAAHTTGALAMPFIGGLMDRHGVRRIALPAIAAFALVLAGISLLPGVPFLFVLAYGLLGLVGAGNSTLAYARVVSTWFNQRRGLALGLTLSGVGLGTASVPQVARLLVADYGWRGAYIGLGLLLFMIAAPGVAFLVRDRSPERGRDDADGVEITIVTGLSLQAAVSKVQFWAIGLALFLVSLSVNGMIAHIIPLLVDRHVSTTSAATALSATGLALILGRVLSGYCLDRFFAPFVSAMFFMVPLCGIILLSSGANGPWALFAAILLGIGLGAEVDIMAFLVGRYFGLAHYGAIYGTLLALFTLASGWGVWLIALAFDYFHSYTNALIGCGVALLFASALVAKLGPYRYA